MWIRRSFWKKVDLFLTNVQHSIQRNKKYVNLEVGPPVRPDRSRR